MFYALFIHLFYLKVLIKIQVLNSFLFTNCLEFVPSIFHVFSFCFILFFFVFQHLFFTLLCLSLFLYIYLACINESIMEQTAESPAANHYSHFYCDLITAQIISHSFSFSLPALPACSLFHPSSALYSFTRAAHWNRRTPGHYCSTRANNNQIYQS